MSIQIDKAKRIIFGLEQKKGLKKIIQQLKSDYSEIVSSLPKDNTTLETEKRLDILNSRIENLRLLIDVENHPDLNKLDGSIENFVGFTHVPTGIAGPIRVNGTEAKGDYLVPLATTEGALVASYHRGAKATLLSGGITSICLSEGVRRSPLFGFNNIPDAMEFIIWIKDFKEIFQEITHQKSRFGKLVDISINVEGNHVILTFEYLTGDASGQNMVTICTDAICQYIIENCPIKTRYWYVEGNYSGDKKANSLSFTTVRGKKATAECFISKEVLASVLKTTADAVDAYWRSSTVSVIQSGSIGAQGHFANGLTALYLATGQDVACVAEAAVGLTRMEALKDGSLYISVTLPNLILGTIGGGTKFTTQKECLKIMECDGEGKARKYAEICAALLLCGELSIASALAEGHFTSAHEKLGRTK